MKIRLLASSLVILSIFSGQILAENREISIKDSKHNLSVTGRGDIKSSTETRICIFCHTSHNASKEGPLWNHETTAVGAFSTYDRSTLKSRPEQPNGATKLCLSCHDGTIAVGAIKGLNRPVRMQNVGGSGEIPSNRKSNLGHDLSGTHPVSVRYEADVALKNKNLRWPPADPGGEVGVDSNGYIQCTSCHDPHGGKSTKYPFWKKETFDEVCVACHKY